MIANFIPVKIYIVGAITNLDYNEAYRNFMIIENKLRSMGYEPINPMRHLGIPPHWKWAQAKPHCLKAIEQCDGLYVQSNYNNSEGSPEEIEYAKSMGKEIFYAHEGGMKKLEQLSRKLFERTTQ